jgi:hypothetical protein
MSNAEADRKMLLKNSLKYLDKNKTKFDQLYIDFRACFLSKGDIVYREGAKADTLYVIYMGQFQLEKNILIPYNKENNKIKNITVLTLGKGAIAGLESLEYIPDTITINQKKIKKVFDKSKEDPVYKFTLKASENAIAIAIKIEILNEVRENFVKSLLPLRQQKEKVYEEALDKKLKERNRLKLTYNENIMNKYVKNINHHWIQKLNDDKVNKLIDDSKKRPKDKNKKEFKTVKIERPRSLITPRIVHTDNDISEDTQRPPSYYENFITSDNFFKGYSKNINTIDTIAETTVDDQNYKQGTSIPPKKSSDKLMPIRLAIKELSEASKAKPDGGFSFLYMAAKKSVAPVVKDTATINAENSYSNKAQNTHLNAFHAYRKSLQRNKDSKTQNEMYYTTSEKVYPKYKLNEDGKSHHNRGSLSRSIKENLYCKYIYNVVVSRKYAKIKEKLVLTKGVKDNLKNWKLALKDSHYDSGSFDMPLICLSQR